MALGSNPATYRRLASRLGFALRDARRTLSRDDPTLLKLKGVLWQLGNETRPVPGESLPRQLERAPTATSTLAQLFAALAGANTSETPKQAREPREKDSTDADCATDDFPATVGHSAAQAELKKKEEPITSEHSTSPGVCPTPSPPPQQPEVDLSVFYSPWTSRYQREK